MGAYCLYCLLLDELTKSNKRNKVRSRYNYKGLKPLYCKKHKLNDMVNSKSVCIYGSCKKEASYNYKNNKKRLYCKEHKKENMFPVRKLCEYKDCEKYPSFNERGKKGRKFCKEHASETMITIGKVCIEKDCKTMAYYNYKNNKKRLYCNKHKKEDMINIHAKYCIEKNCEVQSCFNYITEKVPLYCNTHKKEGMVDIKSIKCVINDCNNRPIYNFEGEQPKYCGLHKKDNMIDVVTIKCNQEMCLVRGNIKYDGYCTFCFVNKFPKDKRVFQIRKKSKELKVRDYINENFKGFIHDKPLWTSNCNCDHRRRIDHRKLINDTLLCIETDEGQHKRYSKEDEQNRLNDIFMVHGGKIIFIRFNPDSYKDNFGKKRNPQMKTRLRVLGEEINKQIDRIEKNKNIKIVENIFLYYDFIL